MLQAPRVGTNVRVLTGVTGRKLSFKRSSTPEVTGTIDLEHDDAYAINALVSDGEPILRGFRLEPQGDNTTLAVARVAGVISPISEQAAEGTVNFTARGVFERLEGYLIGDPDAPWSRDFIDAGDAMLEVLAEANAERDTGIVPGANPPSSATLDSLTYEGKVNADAIVELAGTRGGPDYEVIPVANENGEGSTLGRFEVYAPQGIDRPEAVFGYGAGTVGNCTDADRQTSRPRNRVIVYGDEGIRGIAEDVQSQDRYGLWTYTESMSDTVDLSLLQARADELLQPDPARIVSFTPDASRIDASGAPLAPQPWLDYWLGDTVRAIIRKGAFVYDGTPRIDALDIELDDDGFESAHVVQIATPTEAV